MAQKWHRIRSIFTLIWWTWIARRNIRCSRCGGHGCHFAFLKSCGKRWLRLRRPVIAYIPHTHTIFQFELGIHVFGGGTGARFQKALFEIVAEISV